MVKLELTHKTTTIELKKYFDATTGWILQLVNAHDKQKKKHSFCKESNEFAKQLDFTTKEITIKDKETETAKNMKKEPKAQGLNQLKNSREQKPMNRRYGQRFRNTYIDIVRTNRWLKSTRLMVGPERFIIAAQD